MTATRWLDRRIASPGPHLALCLSEDEFKAACRHLKATAPPWIKTPQAHATLHWFERPDAPLTAVLCMQKWQGRDPIEVAGLLVHEAVHVWQGYADHIGESGPGLEQEAYAVQAIAQEFMAEFARRQRGHRRH